MVLFTIDMKKWNCSKYMYICKCYITVFVDDVYVWPWWLWRTDGTGRYHLSSGACVRHQPPRPHLPGRGGCRQTLAVHVQHPVQVYTPDRERPRPQEDFLSVRGLQEGQRLQQVVTASNSLINSGAVLD